MNEERLQEISLRMQQPGFAVRCVQQDICALMAEVRRLQRELRIANEDLWFAQEAAKEPAGVMHGSDGLPASCDNCWKLEPGRDGDCWECDQSKTPPSEWTDFSTVPEEISSLQGEGEK